MITEKITQEEIDRQKDKSVHGDYRMKYQVLHNLDADKKQIPFKDSKGVEWDPDSFVTDVQVTDDDARKAIEAKQLEVIDGVLPEMKVS